MGFKQGAYAKVWSVEPGESGKFTKARISISRKNQEGVYEQEFADFLTLIGEANAKARKSLKVGDVIKLGGTDVTTRYNKETKKQFTNFLVFSYEPADFDTPKPQSNEVTEPEAVEATPEPAEPTDLPF